MECRKFALLSLAVAMVLLAAMAPTVTAARNRVMPFSAIAGANIRNPFADVFSVKKSAEKCVPSGEDCSPTIECCSGLCVNILIYPPKYICVGEAMK